MPLGVLVDLFLYHNNKNVFALSLRSKKKARNNFNVTNSKKNKLFDLGSYIMNFLN